jgi:hypothetical protein
MLWWPTAVSEVIRSIIILIQESGAINNQNNVWRY